MNKYIRLDAEQFLRDSHYWKDEIKRLEDELDSISELKAAPQTPVKSSNVSKPVENTVLDRERIQSQIDRLREYQKAFEYAWNNISDYDQEMIVGFFFNPGGSWNFVNAWIEKHHSNRQYCYRDRRLAIESFRKCLETWTRAQGGNI